MNLTGNEKKKKEIGTKIVDGVKKVWNWLDEKKTKIGATIYLAGKVMLWVNPAVGVTAEICITTGEIIGGGGILHWFTKEYKKKKNGK